jgi:triacylglycerol lipase
VTDQGRTFAAKRVHVVLIPGFAGFDALGQLEYYAGVTRIFPKRLSKNGVLHYFDNFPTAAVVTRATRLCSYLAKRMARREISTRDDTVLIGHSTGGLDIRRLLWDLHRRKRPIVVDGEVEVKPQDLLRCVRRVVFLSVPHWGTNIADWVHAEWVWRKALIADLRGVVAGSQLLLVDRLESAITANAASLSGAELFRAMQDALDEANENNGRPSPMRTAEAQEAASELALYLRHMASDFGAIDDLTSCPPTDGETMSPAHFDSARRKEELQHLRRIRFRSYVTIGRRPFGFVPGSQAPPWELAKPWTYPEICRGNTDIVYRACYRACAGGPFEPPPGSEKLIRRLKGAPHDSIEVWDNDGIVNTLSMLWPEGENVLVRGDHMDIVGQYRLIKAEPGGGREYRAYDLLRSDSGFSERMFEKVWKEIFAFCLGD